MFELIREDLRTYREGFLAQGFWALAIHRFGSARRRFRSRFIRVPWAIAHVMLSKFSQIFFGIQIGMNAQIGRRFIIEHFGAIIIHDQTIIGDDVIVRQGVTIGNYSMDRPLEAPRIGNRVNIGAGAKVLGPIEIGDDVNIGANAVVITSVPAGHLAVGIPATIKMRRKPPVS